MLMEHNKAKFLHSTCKEKKVSRAMCLVWKLFPAKAMGKQLRCIRCKEWGTRGVQTFAQRFTDVEIEENKLLGTYTVLKVISKSEMLKTERRDGENTCKLSFL